MEAELKEMLDDIDNLKLSVSDHSHDASINKVNDSFPFTIAMSWKSEPHNATGDNHQIVTVFPNVNSIPSFKAPTFYRPGTFTVDVKYADASQLQAHAKISTYTCEKANVNVKVRLNLHGSVSVESATLLKEEEIDVPVVKEASKMDTYEAPVNTAGSDVNMEDAKGTTDVLMADNGVPDGDNPVQVETDTKVDVNLFSLFLENGWTISQLKNNSYTQP